LKKSESLQARAKRTGKHSEGQYGLVFYGFHT